MRPRGFLFILIGLAFTSLITATAAAAQAVGTISFGGASVSASQFQYSASALLSGSASYTPSMMLRAMGSASDFSPDWYQVKSAIKSSSGGAQHDNRDIILDNEALQKIR
jgi:hypothetical protein